MTHSIAGLVLMGGASSRMGGGDKALLRFGDATLLDSAIARFAPQVGTLALSANGDASRLAAFGLPVLADPETGPEGPLGGVISGLAWAASIDGVTHLATIPADAPCPALDLVARLAAAAGDGAAVATGPNGMEPLHALWPVYCIARLEALIADGARGPKRALERLGAALVPFAQPEAFLDVDTPADLDRVKKLIGG